MGLPGLSRPVSLPLAHAAHPTTLHLTTIHTERREVDRNSRRVEIRYLYSSRPLYCQSLIGRQCNVVLFRAHVAVAVVSAQLIRPYLSSHGEKDAISSLSH